MKKTLLLLLFCSLSCLGQKSFIPGYYINNNGVKISGLIQYRDYSDTPQSFKFKSTDNAEEQKIEIKDAKEVSIIGKETFKRFYVEYETEQVRNNKEFNIKSPELLLETKQLFVKALVGGDVNLYSLILGDVRFYYIQNKTDVDPILLQHKIYYTQLEYDGSNQLKEINNFRKQLSEKLNCNKLSLKNFLALEYKEKPIKEIVTENNYCGEGFVNYDTIKHRRSVIFTPFIDLIHNTVKYQKISNLDSYQGLSFSVGSEVSLLLSQVNKNFEVFSRASFGKYKLADDTLTEAIPGVNASRISGYEFNATLLNLELGIRYSIIANEKNKLFADFSLGYSHISGEFKQINRVIYDESVNQPNIEASKEYDISSTLLSQVGLGYEINWQYGIELKYNFISNNYLNTYLFLENKHNMLSLSLRYSIIRPKFAKK